MRKGHFCSDCGANSTYNDGHGKPSWRKHPIEEGRYLCGKCFAKLDYTLRHDYLLNAELLYSGHAEILTQYCARSEFSSEDWALEFGC
jgi:hypothetical protein